MGAHQITRAMLAAVLVGFSVTADLQADHGPGPTVFVDDFQDNDPLTGPRCSGTPFRRCPEPI